MSIRVTALGKSFAGHKALQDISFHVPENAFFCVVGPSGCGKSTLLRLIAGLEAPDVGEIALGGAIVAGPGVFVPPEVRQTGVVFQSYALWPHLSVARNVAFPYEAKGLSRARALERARLHLQTVALASLAERRPEALSGGQRQRVALARCLAGEARTILMDEPLANLDPHLRATMEAELRAFHDRSGATTLYITHDQREAMALADIMAVMEAGRLLQVGSPQEIYERPACARVAQFIGRGTLLPARMIQGRAQLLGQQVVVAGAAQKEGAQTLFVRPNHIELADQGWPATLESLQYRGGFWEGTVQGAGAEVPVMIDLAHPVPLGTRLHLRFTGGWVLPEHRRSVGA